MKPAPLTGHLVLSTLHTNVRARQVACSNAGIEPFLVTTANTQYRQRHRRAGCTHLCKPADHVDEQALIDASVPRTDQTPSRWREGRLTAMAGRYQGLPWHLWSCLLDSSLELVINGASAAGAQAGEPRLGAERLRMSRSQKGDGRHPTGRSRSATPPRTASSHPFQRLTEGLTHRGQPAQLLKAMVGRRFVITSPPSSADCAWTAKLVAPVAPLTPVGTKRLLLLHPHGRPEAQVREDNELDLSFA